MASLEATPQQTLEQYSLPMWRSRLPHEADPLRRKAGGGPDHVVVLQHGFQVLESQNVRVLVVPVQLRLAAGVEVLEPGGDDDAAAVDDPLAPGAGDREAEIGGVALARRDLVLQEDLDPRLLLDALDQPAHGDLGRLHVRRQGGVVLADRRAAEEVLLLDEDDGGPELGRTAGRLEAGRTPSDDRDGLRHRSPR